MSGAPSGLVKSRMLRYGVATSGLTAAAGTRMEAMSKECLVIIRKTRSSADSLDHSRHWDRFRSFTGGLLTLSLVGCWRDVATKGVMMRFQASVDHADGRPARGVDLWYVDHGLTRRQRQAVLPKNPVCRTDSAGKCSATITYLYTEPPFNWTFPWRSEYDGRFEMRTFLNGK